MRIYVPQLTKNITLKKKPEAQTLLLWWELLKAIPNIYPSHLPDSSLSWTSPTLVSPNTLMRPGAITRTCWLIFGPMAVANVWQMVTVVFTCMTRVRGPAIKLNCPEQGLAWKFRKSEAQQNCDYRSCLTRILFESPSLALRASGSPPMFGVMNLASFNIEVNFCKASARIFQFLSPISVSSSGVMLPLKDVS